MTESGAPGLFRLYKTIATGLPGQTANGGVVGDQRHGSGYHRSRNALRAARKYGDYSIQASRDKKGNGNYASGLDVTFHSTSKMIEACKRLEKACLAKDPRLNVLREWIGTLNGRTVIGYSPYRGKYITSSDKSHLWHIHLSVFRDSNMDDALLNQIAAVIVGKPDKPYVWDGKSFPGASRFYIGVKASWVTYLGKMLVKAGYKGYTTGPSSEFTAVDKAGVMWFQKKTPELATDADGIPGPLTWSMLQAIYNRPVPAPPKPPQPPTPPPVPPKPPKPPVPPKPKTGFSKVIELDAPGGGNWQGAAQNIKTKEWFVAHSRARSDGKEDVVLYHFDRAGKYKDKMTLSKCSHVYGFGVSDTNVVWLTWNDSSGNDVVTFQYKAGKTISKKNTSLMHVFSNRSVDISFSPTRYWAVLRQAGYPANFETYRLYTKKDVLAGRDKPWGKDVRIRVSPSRVVQGFSVSDKNLYVLVGLSPKSAFRIEKWSFATGKKVAEMKLPSNIGLSEVSVKSGRKTEPEGMDGTTFGIKAGEGSDRRMIIYKLNNF